MKLSRIGRASLAMVASLSMGLGMTACGGGTSGFLYVFAGKATSNSSGNVITGFKIDDYTGNLTEMVGSPYSASGSNPIMGVFKPGGRFLYVLLKGDSGTAASSGIALFSVGGDGVLTYQQTYYSKGSFPQWIQIDSTGSYLYALDQRAPDYDGTTIPIGCKVATCGSITVFSIAGDTGRLTTQFNTSQKDTNGNYITYYPVGSAPFQMKYLTSGTLLTINGDNTVTAYNSGTSGQLVLPSGQGSSLTQATSVNGITSVTSGGSYLYLTESPSTTYTGGRIFSFSVSNGILSATNGSPTENFATNVTPVWTLTDSRSKFVYVLNSQGTGATTGNSSISAFTIDSNGKLTKLSGTTNPYPVGANPVCLLQDPTNKYVYTSNSGTSAAGVTGFEINQATGELVTLRRGSTFPITGQAACLVTSGNVT